MESRKSNLFIGDRSFQQNWSLKFREGSTERKFLLESLRFHWQSLQYLYIWAILLWFYLYYSSSISLSITILGLLILITSILVKDVFPKRIILQGFCLIWQTTTFVHESLPECFGLLLPSFILNFFLLKSWQRSLYFLLADLLWLYFHLNISLKTLTLCSFTYILLASTLEKDFRDIWQLYSSYKKSNCLNKALWDKYPGVELLVSSDGRIIHYNPGAVNYLKGLNRSLDILKGGLFEEFFDDFKVQARHLVNRSLKGEITNEIYLNKNNESDLGLMIFADLHQWTTGNVSRIICINITNYLMKRQLIAASLNDIKGFLQYLTKSISECFVEDQPITSEIITTFFRVSNSFIGTNAIQGFYSRTIEILPTNFDINSEIFNIIEQLYLKSTQHNVSIIYTREKGIPASILGDKAMHGLIIFSLLDYVIENSIENSDINLLVQVSSAVNSDVTLSYKITFQSEKLNNYDIEALITTRKHPTPLKDLKELRGIAIKHGIALASIDLVLLTLKGYLNPMSTEVERNKVMINICLPFKTSEIRVNTKLFKICKTIIYETPLTTKWKPEKELNNIDINETGMLKGQISMLKERQRRCTEKLDGIFIEPINKQSGEIGKKPSSSSLLSNQEMDEFTDVSSKMKSYEGNQCELKRLIDSRPNSYVLEEGSASYKEFSEYIRFIVVISQKTEIQLVELFEELNLNIIHVNTTAKAVFKCQELCGLGKNIAVLWNIEDEDQEFVECIRKLESRDVRITICAILNDYKHEEFCRTNRITNYSNIHIVSSPVQIIELKKFLSALPS